MAGDLIALFGDSLVEGMNYTTSPGATVGARASLGVPRPRRVWLAATVDPQCIYATSNRDYNTTPKTYSGVARALRIEANGTIRFPLLDIGGSNTPAMVRVWFRRDDGTEFTGANVTATPHTGTAVTLSGAQTDPSGFMTEYLDLVAPGQWVDVTFVSRAGEILGVEVWRQAESAEAGGAVWAFGVTGQNSDEWQDSVHRWRSYRSLLQQLGCTTVAIAIMANDANQSVSVAQYTTNIETGMDHIRDYLPAVEFVAVLMPDVGGHDLSAYRAALAGLCDESIDCTSMPLTMGAGGNVGADGTHWTDKGNENFAALFRAGLNHNGLGYPAFDGAANAVRVFYTDADGNPQTPNLLVPR